MQDPVPHTAAEQPSLLTVKAVRYVASIRHAVHSFEVAGVTAHMRDGKPIVDVDLGSTTRDMSIDEARALGVALLAAVEELS